MSLNEQRFSPKPAPKGNISCSKCWLLLGSHDEHLAIDEKGSPCHDYCIPKEERDRIKKSAQTKIKESISLS